MIATSGGTERRVAVDHILVATGRRPNTADLGVDAAGIALDDKGAIVVNETLRTTNPLVFAAGDVTNAPQFVYVAAHYGAAAGENALPGRTRRVDLTSPQIAAAGLTEVQGPRCRACSEDGCAAAGRRISPWPKASGWLRERSPRTSTSCPAAPNTPTPIDRVRQPNTSTAEASPKDV